MNRRQLNDNHRELLAKLVRGKGLSQRELANTIHHSQGWLAHHLSGNRKSIDHDDLKSLLMVLYDSDDPNIIERFLKEADALKENVSPWINHPKFEISVEKSAAHDFNFELPKALKEFCDVVNKQINNADDDSKRFILLRMLITMTKNMTYTPKLSIVLNSIPVFTAEFNSRRHSDVDRATFALLDKCYGYLFGSEKTAMYPPAWRLEQHTVALDSIQATRSCLFEMGSSNEFTPDSKEKLNELLATLNNACQSVFISCNGLSVLSEDTVLDGDLIDTYLNNLNQLKKKVTASLESTKREIKEIDDSLAEAEKNVLADKDYLKHRFDGLDIDVEEVRLTNEELSRILSDE